MFSCEYCEIYKNTYFEEYLRAAAFILSHFHTHTKLFGFLMDFSKKIFFLLNYKRLAVLYLLLTKSYRAIGSNYWEGYIEKIRFM